MINAYLRTLILTSMARKWNGIRTHGYGMSETRASGSKTGGARRIRPLTPLVQSLFRFSFRAVDSRTLFEESTRVG